MDTEPKKRGRKFERPPRPDIRLTAAYASKIGAECGQLGLTIRECRGAMLAADRFLADELERVEDRLMQLQEIFQ